MVDRGRALALLSGLRASLDDLDRYATTVDARRLHVDRDAQNMVLFAIYTAAQAAIDLAYHITADEGGAVPATYRAGFESLRELGWIDDELATRLAGWAGLRNVIAHGYLKLDFDRVHTTLGERGDLRRFSELMAARIGVGG